MLVAERRLQRLDEERGKGGGRDRALIDRELALFQRIEKELSAEIPLRHVALKDDERQMLQGFGLLSLIPQLIIVNQGEGQQVSFAEIKELDDPVLDIYSKLEMEIAQLAPEEQADFLQEYGLEQAGRDRIIQASFQMLDLIAFFTGNEEEVRAWTLKKGGTCLQAADRIHSDLARGFIRAEVIAWDELVALGGMTEARAAGKLRVEGKEGAVEDGDLVYIRFNL
jgi:hypothetical protein